MLPQLIYLGLLLLGLGESLYKNGEPKTGKHSFGWSLVSSVIVVYILYKGGFFDVLIPYL